MHREHLIERAVFDIGFASNASARAQERSLATLVQRYFLPVVEEIFDEVAPRGVVRIDRLEIDLGQFVDGRHMQQEMVERFRNRLRAVLAKQLAELDNGRNETAQDDGAIRDHLLHFLESGQLEHGRDGVVSKGLNATIEELLQGDGKRFADYVRGTPARAVVLKRLSKQFPDNVLARVLQRLGGWSDAERAVLEERIAGLRSRMGPQESGEYLSNLWERLMHVVADANEDTESVLADAEARASIDSGGTMPEHERPLVEFPVAAEEGTAPLQSDDTATAPWQAVAKAFESALDKGDATSLIRYLRAPVAERMRIARQVFLARLDGETERRRLMERLSVEDLRSVVALLVPTAAEAAEVVMDEMRREVNEAGTVEEIRRAVWMQLLAILHASEASLSDRSDFLGRLHRRLSGFGDEGNTVDGKRQEEREVGSERSASAEGRGVSQGRLGDLEQAVWSRLGGAPGEELGGLLAELGRVDPHFPGRFTAQLRERARRLTLAGLSVAELENLVALALRGHDGADGPALHRRIAEGGRQERELRGYYGDILAVLLGEGVGGVSIGGIVGPAPAEQGARDDFLQDQNQVAETALDEGNDGLHPAIADPLEGAEVRMDVGPGAEALEETPLSGSPDGWYVRIAAALGSGDPASASGIWDAALSRHGDLVSEVFKHLPDGQIRRLADHFPTPMLLELVRLLAPYQMSFIVALARDPALAEPIPRVAGPTGDTGRPRALWRALLCHLHSRSGDLDGQHFGPLLLAEAATAGLDLALVHKALAHANAEASEYTGASLGDKSLTQLSGQAYKEQQRDWIERWLFELHDRAPTAAERRHRRTQLDRLAAERPEIIERLYARRDFGDTDTRLANSGWHNLLAALVAFKGPAIATDLRHHIDAAADRLRDPQNFFRNLCFDLLDGRNIDLESAANETSSGTRENGAEPTDRLRRRLERLFGEERDTAVAAEWQERLDQGQGALLASIARPHMADPAMAVRLISSLTEYAVDSLIRRLSPAAGAYFADLLSTLQTGNDDVLLSSAEATEIARLIRRYALTHLANTGYDSSDGSRRKDLFAYLEQATASWPSSRKVMRSIHTGLFRAPAEAIQTAEDALYARIVRHLEGDIDDSDMADRIASLARRSPQLMMRLYRQLQAGNTEIDVARLSLPEVRQLVVEFIGLGHSGDRSTFLVTVEREAALARNRDGYYRTILGNLVKNRMIDIEATKQVDSGAGEKGSGGQAIPDAYATDGLAVPTVRDDVPPSADGTPGNAGEIPSPLEHGVNGIDSAEDHLFARIASRVAGAEGDALSAEEFATISDDRIAALCRLLESGAVSAKVAALSRDEARLLVARLIELHRSPSMTGNGFAEAIAAYAAEARDETAYYRYLLERLVANEAVDLEAATRVPSPPASKPATPEASPQPAAAGFSTASVAPDVAAPVQESAPEAAPSAFSLQVGGADEPDRWEEAIYVANAGLVLAAPYLPRLFDVLELTEQGRFRDEETAERAVHLLQYAVNERCDSPEFLLVLNKLLCGIPRGMPIAGRIEASPRERETVDSLLSAIIENWKIIGNTSLQGLRESFLQRAGRLRQKGEEWFLEVETRGIDVLLDQLPWSFSLIKYGWMNGPIHVGWR